MNKLRKNQITIYTIALMLVLAGYLSYIGHNNSLEISANMQNTNNIGDATLVSNNEIQEECNSTTEIEENVEDVVNTSNDDEYFINSKLEREKMYSQMLETYQKILESASVSEEQKSIASNEITKINNNRNAIMICENLIKIKGFNEVIILANGESVNVVIKSKELSSEEIAQIQNIIMREMETEIENIHIMKK